MAGFSQDQFNRDRNQILRDVRHYGLHKDVNFMNSLNGYLDQLQRNGEWINQGATPNENWVGREVGELIHQFDRKHAFHVPAGWWRQHRNDANFRQDRSAKAAETRQNGYLWSKTEPGPAARRAAQANGLILETSVPGKLFDGKNFGFEKWSDSPTMGKLWENFSTHYVDGLEGPVKAVVLDGIVDNSVLTRLEWPHLLDRIQSGDVPHMRVNVMNIVGDSNNSSTWSLQTVAGFDVRSQESFDNLPRPTNPEFWTLQSRWHERQRAQAGSSSDSASSGASDEYSLHNFHEVFDRPNTVVVLSDPGADRSPGHFTASPEQLSRVATNQLSRQETNELLQVPSMPATAAVHAGADTLAMATLDYKLDAIRTEQERRGSNGTSPARSASVTESQAVSELTDSLSRMAPLTSAGGYYPQGTAPNSGSFPPGTLVSNTPYTIQPPASSMYTNAPAYTTTSPSESAYGYPAPPVSGAQTFNPTFGDTQNRTPSTSSASSNYGEPLERTHRNPSPPSEPQRPAPSSSSSGRGDSGKKSKKPKEVSGLVAWMGGAQYKKKGGPSK